MPMISMACIRKNGAGKSERRKIGQNWYDPPKSEWDNGQRDRFLAFLGRCGWEHLGKDHLGADLFQLGGARLAVDEHGLFVFTIDRENGRWVQRAGLSDNLIDACSYQYWLALWPLYLEGEGKKPHELDLRTGEIWLLNRFLTRRQKEQPCYKTQK
jgi:hypothetical protein